MPVIIVALACLLALVMCLLVRSSEMAVTLARMSAGRQGESLVGDVLDTCGGEDRLDDIVVGHLPRRCAQVDHLIRLPQGLLVLETKNWSGLVDGSADAPRWKVSKRSGEVIDHKNPLLQAGRQAMIVAAATGNRVPVAFRVVMTGRARHQSGSFPAGVVNIRELPRVLAGLTFPDVALATVPGTLDDAWKELVEDAFSPEAELRASRYSAWLHDRFSTKPWLAWMVAAMAIAALAWTMGVRGDITVPMIDYLETP